MSDTVERTAPAPGSREGILEQLDSLHPSELKRLLVDLMARQRVGLYWERDLIERDRALNDGHVLTELDPDLSCGPGPWRNLILEGENADALRLLRTTHRNRIRVILIDPPYNTGNKDFVYNDRLVGKDDAYRQSMWLEFMYRRLTLARDLLTPDGVILVCINDENRARLDLLMEQVFPGRRVGSLVWKTRSGTNDPGDHFFSADHEHVLVYANKDFKFSGTEKSEKLYRFDDLDGRGKWMSDNLTVSVRYDDKRAGKAYYPLHDPTTDIWYPCDPERVWAYGSAEFQKAGKRLKTKTMEAFVADRKIAFPEGERVEVWETLESLMRAIDAGDVPSSNGRPLLRRGLPNLESWVGRKVGWGKPRFKRHLKDVKNKTKPLSSWLLAKSVKSDKASADSLSLSVPYTTEGTSLLISLFGQKVFNYPKPPTLIRDLLNQVTEPGDIILDFFAGSGTTGEAVLELNAEDEGGRRFILVSSTEEAVNRPGYNLCRDVCAARLRKVIEGEGTKRPGVEGDFAYARLTKLAEADLAYEVTPAHLWTAVTLRHQGLLTPWPGTRVARLPQDGDTPVLVCIATDERTVDELATELPRLGGRALVYADRPGALGRALAMRLPADLLPWIEDVADTARTAPAGAAALTAEG